MGRAVPFLSLFTSSATLVCCALPALFVTLGLGATFAGLLAAWPQLIWLSENKVWVFSLAGLMLTATFLLRRAAQSRACPVDPAQRDACQSARSTSDWIFRASVLIYLTGVAFALGA